MISFFIRISIVTIAIVGISFFSGVSNMSFIAVVLFLCAWISIRSFDDLFWWIVCVAFFYSIMHYDFFGIYFMGIIGSTFIFDFAKKHVMRNRYEGLLVHYALSILVIGLLTVFVGIFYRGHWIFTAEDFLYAVFFSFFIFLFLRIIIGRFEKFADLYVRGSDLKCHT